MHKVRIIAGSIAIFILCFCGGTAPTPYSFLRLDHFPEMPLSPENPVTVEGVNLGRYLFYDRALSADNNLSCSSCHKQEYAFSDAPEQFSKGRNGVLMQRNTMPLFNLAWYPAMFWDGKAKNIEEQISHPITAENEMNLRWGVAIERLGKNKLYRKMFNDAFGNETMDSARITKAIAQFLRTLISNKSKYDRAVVAMDRFSKEEYDGFVLMNDQTKGDCLHCHTTDADVLGTTLKFSNNGLDAIANADDYKDKGRGGVTGKKEDNGKFMIPSLRNIALTAPYMHDGRFKTLEEVLEFYSSGVKDCANIDSKMEFVHEGGAKLTKTEQQHIIAFLKTMTDTAFITNPEFSDPFRNK